MKKYKDTDLREALRRKYADTPQLPADFLAGMEARLSSAPHSVPSGLAAGRRTRLLRWMAAAACLLLVVGIGITFMSEEEQEKTPSVAQKAEPPKPEETKVETGRKVEAVADSRQRVPTSVEAVADSRQRVPPSVEAVADLRQEEPTSVGALQKEYAQQTNRVQQAEPASEVLTECDIPITRPENYKYTPEEIALMKKQAREAYLKWVELELEIAKHCQEQTAQE